MLCSEKYVPIVLKDSLRNNADGTGGTIGLTTHLALRELRPAILAHHGHDRLPSFFDTPGTPRRETLSLPLPCHVPTSCGYLEEYSARSHCPYLALPKLLYGSIAGSTHAPSPGHCPTCIFLYLAVTDSRVGGLGARRVSALAFLDFSKRKRDNVEPPARTRVMTQYWHPPLPHIGLRAAGCDVLLALHSVQYSEVLTT